MTGNKINSEKVLELYLEATKVKNNSYSPYSKFRVGCALLDDENRIWTGTNVENCSYGGAICAERSALVAAVSAGKRKFRALLVTTDISDSIPSPCGICRQFMAEFLLEDTPVFCTKSAKEDYILEILGKDIFDKDSNRDIKEFTMGSLLPDAFTLADKRN